MTARTALLKQLVADGTYPIDEAVIAEAILVRSMARQLVPDLALHCTTSHPADVRSFRPHRGARSFRLVRSERRSLERRLPVAA
ncbi:MAG TPA: flagellar biosynthesis anti-sigma factor FlgM [Solirubrobacteraceae bacterium]|nr:flagellar biosynthesis anti-sigma factor FlgM [Solirubrobacteraceae bacterium]